MIDLSAYRKHTARALMHGRRRQLARRHALDAEAQAGLARVFGDRAAMNTYAARARTWHDSAVYHHHLMADYWDLALHAHAAAVNYAVQVAEHAAAEG